MKLTIFTGLTNRKRFFDQFLNDEGFTESEYSDCARHDYEMNKAMMDTRISDLLYDEQSFQACLKGISQSDINRFIHSAYRNDIERELISDHIQENAKKMVIELWIQDSIAEVKRIYREN
jgi:hypothetical protein